MLSSFAYLVVIVARRRCNKGDKKLHAVILNRPPCHPVLKVLAMSPLRGKNNHFSMKQQEKSGFIHKSNQEILLHV